MGISNRVRVIPVLLAMSLAGCGDSSGPAGLGAVCGSSSATVTGAVSASLNSCAVFVVAMGSGGVASITVIGGSAAAPTHLLSLGRDGVRPSVGSYGIGAAPGQISGAFNFDGGSSADRTFYLSSGTVTITTSTASTLSATLTSVVGTEAAVGAPTVTITGTFSAKCVATASTTC